MKLKKLLISNILTFEYQEDIEDATEITFNDDLNIIIGQNGAGKSTVLEIINFIFKRVLYNQFNIDSSTVNRKNEITANDLKNSVQRVNSLTINEFRLAPNRTTENLPQKIFVELELDEIDRSNIKKITDNFDKINKTINLYCNYNPLSEIVSEFISDTIKFEIKLIKSSNKFENELIENGVGFRYLANFDLLKEIIHLHNLENVDDHIEPLNESFVLIGSYRNYSKFNSGVSLSERSSSEQIQSIKDKDYQRSLNSSEIEEPDIFNLVRLQVADVHFKLDDTNKTNDEREFEANNQEFLQKINSTLKLINIQAKIKLKELRKWLYSFEFIEMKNGTIIKDINSLSAGQKSIIHLVFESYGRGLLKGGVIIIDEPEIHLHYQLQSEYLKIIEKLKDDLQCQYILVTHSESLINSKTINKVKRFSLNKDGFSEIKSPQFTSDQKTLIRILDNKRSTYSFFARKVLLVEGDTDRFLFKSIIDHLYPGHSQEIAVLDMGGKDNFKTWKDFFLSFGLQVFYIGDSDNIFTLKIEGEKISDKSVYENTKTILKQQICENLNTIEKKELKALSNIIFTDSNINYSNFKNLIETFEKLTKVNKSKVPQKVILDNSEIIKKIKALYKKNIFILQEGCLEDYFDLTVKDLNNVVKFCEEDLSIWCNKKQPKTKEILKIFSKIIEN